MVSRMLKHEFVIHNQYALQVVKHALALRLVQHVILDITSQTVNAIFVVIFVALVRPHFLATLAVQVTFYKIMNKVVLIAQKHAFTVKEM